MILAYPKGVHAGAASWDQSLRFPAPFNLTRIFYGAVTSGPCLECSISIDVVAEQPFDLGQPAQDDALTFGLETQNSTHDKRGVERASGRLRCSSLGLSAERIEVTRNAS